jgi:hypothetical protein
MAPMSSIALARLMRTASVMARSAVPVEGSILERTTSQTVRRMLATSKRVPRQETRRICE